MPVAAPEIADTCIVVNGVAKTYAMTGWRVGWMIGPRTSIKAATNLQSHLTSNVCNVAQRRRWRPSPGRWTRSRRCARRSTGAAHDRRAALRDPRRAAARPRTGRSTPTRPSQELIGTELRGARIDDTVGLAAPILEQAEVAVVPGEAFGTPGLLPPVLRPGDDDLRTGVERMGALLAEAK